MSSRSIIMPFPARLKTGLKIDPVLVARFLRGERRIVAPYEMYLSEPIDDDENGPE